MAKAQLLRRSRPEGGSELREAPRGELPLADLDLVPMLRRGLRYAAFERIVDRAALGQNEAAVALGIAPRTLARRKTEKKLDPASSERVARLERVVRRAAEVLGDEEAMKAWIRTPNTALGGHTPLSLLDTDVGTHAVLTVLGRLEHGVFS